MAIFYAFNISLSVAEIYFYMELPMTANTRQDNYIYR